MENFNGKVKPYRCFFNGENHKIYACVVTESSLGSGVSEDITIAGDIPELQSGVEYIVKAKPKQTKYGYTYYVNHITVDMKGAGRSIYYKTFLESVTSQDLADNILGAYPNFVTLVLEGKDKEIDLNKIKGVGDFRFKQIKEKILSNMVIMDVLEEYGMYELTFSMASKILASCNGSIDLVREKMQANPYKLLTNISGIGFKRADELILKVRPELKDSKYRLFSCVDYLLEENEKNGSTWMYFRDLYSKISESCPEAISHAIKVVENTNDFYFDKKENRIGRAYIRRKEEYIANRIVEIINGDDYKYDWKSRIKGEINYEEFRNLDGKFDLSDEQMKTLPMVFENNFCVLTGSAGMGKSSGAKGLLNAMDKYNFSYTLTAPTGAASEVLADYTNRRASTIHRVILKTGDESDMKKIYTNLLIIDEASMINTDLMYDTLMEVEDGTKVLLICDPEQLPAIGAGKVIHDLIESGIVPVNKLTKVYRFDEGGLAQISTKARLGEKFLPKSIDSKSVTFGTDKDYSFILSEKKDMMNDILQVYFAILRSGVDISDIGIMSSMNVKDLGTIHINKTIQERISKGKPFVKYGDTEYRLGDKVVQTKNNYDASTPSGNPTDIFNGNQGKIINVYPSDKMLVVEFKNGKKIMYQGEDLKDLSLAYATSVHKFQGSGCKIALVVTPSSHTFMLNKNLLYTALTRSSVRTIHFSDKIQTINIALGKSENYTRSTFLKELLIEFANNQ